MKKKTTKWVSLLGAAMLMASAVGCGNTAEAETTGSEAAETETTETETAETETTETEETETETTEEVVSGRITMAGSTSMEKLANAVAEAYMAKYPEVTVTAEFTGSGAGIESLIAGSVDVGNASRKLKEEETAEGVVENIVAIDGIAVITDTSNGVTSLTEEQLVSIYKGEITNWSELGGSDAPIVVIGRESGSGTRDGFESILELEDACNYASELDSTGAVIARVAATPGAIGYASISDVDDTVVKVSINDTEPTVENIKTGSYILSRPFVMATNGEIAEQSAAVQSLFTYLQSDEGKEIVEAVGLITVD